MKRNLQLALTFCAFATLLDAAFPGGAAAAPAAEYNPLRSHPVAIGPEAKRLIVGFRATPANTVTDMVRTQRQARLWVHARTTSADAQALAQRARIKLATSRQITPSTHVLFLQQRLYGAEVEAALRALRSEPSVEYAEVDQRRFPKTVPDDPLFIATTGASGQWYLMTPSALTATSDAAATDAVSAWSLTTGSSGTVIADIDTGVRFEHPDLLRAGLGGRLLPGYDFVGGDLSSTGTVLGTYLAANDGDGWDPDPSDPGDWIDSADQQNAEFPAADCPIQDSSWHGTRVMGILGALTNNAVGIAGMTWDPYILPVRALGKCGGYDSDIITGMQWAAGLSATGVPDNPYPADIINLSLGGSGSCPSDYASAVSTLSAMGVLIVASAGNESGPVDAPGDCAGVLAVAGLRNVGTKVGYSSSGPEVGVAAPAGNCVNESGACLRSIDTTSNTGLTVPAASTYTNETNVNLGTSFASPIVAGIAGLMRAVNANLTPAQLIARIEASSTAFPQPVGTPICASADTSGAECACPNDGSVCGAGMVNAHSAVVAARQPIAAVALPASMGVGTSVVLDASGSAAACGRSVASYAWSATGGATLPGASATGAKTSVTPTGSAGTITLTVTDSAGAVDTATLNVDAGGVITAPATVPSSAGTAASACPTPLTVSPAAPTVAESVAPASVGENVAATLTVTLGNTNAFDLTQSSLTVALPTGLAMPGTSSATTAVPTTTCSGGGAQFTYTASNVSLSGANIPAAGSCTITVPVQSATPGSYVTTVSAAALTTGPAGANKAAASTTLTVTAPSKGGGGSVDWWDTLFVVGVLLAGRRRKRQPNGSR